MRGEWGRWQSEDSTTSRAGTRQAAEQAVAGCSCRVARVEAHKAIDIGSFLFGKDQRARATLAPCGGSEGSAEHCGGLQHLNVSHCRIVIDKGVRPVAEQCGRLQMRYVGSAHCDGR